MDKIQIYWKDYLYPALRDLAAKRLVDYINQQTLDWINNGTEPTFVSNWSQFASDAADIAFDSYNSYLSQYGVDLCSPFVPQLQLMLQSTFVQQQPIRCSIDDFKRNIENSLDLVKNGGWVSYTQAFMPEGNLLGMYVTAESQIIGEAISKRTAAVNEAISSSGFLGQKQCADPDIQSQAEQFCQDQPTAEDVQGCIQLVVKENCTNWEVVTPGDVAAKAVASFISSDKDFAVNIQNFVSMVITSLINKMITRGLSSLKGSSASSDISYPPDGGSIAQFNNTKQQISSYYEDVIYYFDSSDYPTLEIWQNVQSLAQQGIGSCVPPDNWQSKYNNVSAIVSGLQTMLDEAQANLDELNAIDMADVSMDEAFSQKVQEISAKFTSFQNTYQAFLGDIANAKQAGDMTDIEKIAISEKDNLTQSLTTAPDCGSTEVPVQ
jgi:hypothetical protein